ncbi:DnaD domain-containing protein [Tepidiforma sp.]|uniref:DnaD domain-containing protein n=1 Tax=Tepidiforma sp. TaxID=2682230 RepID=UPI002ADE5E63|nr:DnaD domain protein [Tepidiforma sp.]
MTSSTNPPAFPGFPGIARGTAIPNLFFTTVLPALAAPGDLLAFLWVAHLAQQLPAEPRCVSADAIWQHEPARLAFERLAGGRPGLDAGLEACRALRALLAIEATRPGQTETLYFVNNPAARRAIARIRAGELQLPGYAAVAPLAAPEQRPGIFRLYEENIGTITPLVAERLAEAEATYPADWVEAAFREAAERNIRNWRYIERMLQTWAQEGHPDETPRRDPLEDAKHRYLGGNFGHIIKYR